jgi:hypothetical protein
MRHPGKTLRERSSAIRRMRGLLKTDQPAPTDEVTTLPKNMGNKAIRQMT